MPRRRATPVEEGSVTPEIDTDSREIKSGKLVFVYTSGFGRFGDGGGECLLSDRYELTSIAATYDDSGSISGTATIHRVMEIADGASTCAAGGVTAGGKKISTSPWPGPSTVRRSPVTSS